MQVLAEAKRIRDRLAAHLHLIYVGEQDDSTTEKFAHAISHLGLPAESTVHYQAGEPARSILQVCEAHGIELIVAGALEREVILRPFLGNVARVLVREARCSVMLFTKPSELPVQMRQMVFIADHSPHAAAAFKTMLQLAAAERTERVHVVRVYTSFDEARAALGTDPDARTLEEEERALEQFIDAAGPTDVPIEPRCIRGTTGFAALDFIQGIEADLLVVPVDPGAPRGELPHHVAWITDTIPCNLWVIR